MSSDLNIDVCIMSVLGIHMSVHGTSLSVQFDTLKILFLSLLQAIFTVNSPVTPS